MAKFFPKKIKKRDGRIVDFDVGRIAEAIFKAMEAAGQPNRKAAKKLAEEVVSRLVKKHKKSVSFIPTIEEIQDFVEEVLIEKGYAKVAKLYILYRQKRAEIRQEKQKILDKEEIDEIDKRFDINALRVLRSRYLRKDEKGRVIESPKQLFERVALHAALPDILYDERVWIGKGRSRNGEFKEPAAMADEEAVGLEGSLRIGKYFLNRFHIKGLYHLFSHFSSSGKAKIGWQKLAEMLKNDAFKNCEKTVDEFYSLMVSRQFMPNTPALANFGSYLGMGSACFALDIGDSIESIMDTLKKASIIFKSGGGLGYNFSKLRPEGDFIKTTGGASSGPISFMRLFDTMTEVVKQGGCVALDTLIRTDKGMLPIGALLNAPEFRENQTSYFVYDGSDYHHAFLAMNNGRAEIYEITTELGVKLKSTANHLITAVDKKKGDFVWREAENLKIGDWVPIVLGGHFGEEIRLPSFFPNRHFNSNSLNIPSIFTEELAELLGLYMADGCINRGRLIFSVDSQDQDLVERIIYLMDSVFDLKLGSQWKKENQDYVDLVFYSRDLERYFKTTGWRKENAKTAFVPQEIFLSKPEIAKSFLRGLFEGDGTIHNDGYPILISISSRLISEVQQLLLGLGLISKIKRKTVQGIKGHKGLNDIYILIVLTNRSHEKFKNEIRFISERKNNNFLKYFRNKKIEYSDLIPCIPEIFAKYYKRTGRGCGPRKTKKGINSAYYRAVWHYIKGDRQPTRIHLTDLIRKFEFLKTDPALKCLMDEKFFFTRITSIKKKDNVRTMEIEVPASNSYVANGFLVHNIRRGANMGILNSNHPDIEKFIAAKKGNKALKNFNISVLMMPDFWDYYKKNQPYPLINSRTGQAVRFVSPRFLLEQIAYSVWESAEPGILFHDRINEYNPFLKSLGPIVTTNPCGELLLYPNESCNLGSLNVWTFIKTDAKEKKSIDWPRLQEAIKTAVRFLDNVIDINAFPLPEIEEMTLNTRKIGLGLMGLGDLLYDLKIQFNSQKGWDLMERLAEFINYHSKVESVELAKERGPFPYFNKSFYPEGKMPFKGFYDKKSWHLDWTKISRDIKKYGLRNSYTTVVAPTGSISMIAGCSSGIEPVYSLVFQKNVAVGSFYFINPVFEKEMMREGLFDEILIRDVALNRGSIQKISYIPKGLKKIFVTSHDICPEEHIRTLAAFQKWIDSSISKTNNFPAKANVDDMKKSYLLAYEAGCKGVTVFRDTSIEKQVLAAPEVKEKPKEAGLIRLKDEKAEGMAIYRDPSIIGRENGNGGTEQGGRNEALNGNGKPIHCPNCRVELSYQEGCVFCSLCGWGLCA
jgi:ribonucleoside-diphosphate reductase alpha chain